MGEQLLFFDHKPPAFKSRHDSSAAQLVWDRLVGLRRPVWHLKPLVDVVFVGNSMRKRGRYKDEYAKSKRAGFHKTLADAKADHDTDAGVYRAVRKWLDDFHRTATEPDADPSPSGTSD